MRHHHKGRVLSRKKGPREALIRTLATSLIRYGKITTTEAKAKELKPFVERLVTHAKGASLAKRRIVIASVGPTQTKKLFDEYAPKYAKRAGGYTRITKLPPRQRDSSAMAIIELV